MLKKTINKIYLFGFTIIHIQNMQSFWCCTEDTTKKRQVKKENNSESSVLVAIMRDNEKKNRQAIQEKSSIQEESPIQKDKEKSDLQEKFTPSCQNQENRSNENNFSTSSIPANHPGIVFDSLDEQDQHQIKFYFVHTANDEYKPEEVVFTPQEKPLDDQQDSISREISNLIHNSQGQLPSSAVQSTGKFAFYEGIDSNSQQILTIQNNGSISQRILQKQDETRIAQPRLSNPITNNYPMARSNYNEFMDDNSGSRHLPGAITQSSDSLQSLASSKNVSPSQKALQTAQSFQKRDGFFFFFPEPVNQRNFKQTFFQNSKEYLPHRVEEK